MNLHFILSDICYVKYSRFFSFGTILTVLSVLCVVDTSANTLTPDTSVKLFETGKEYVYSYDAASSVGVLFPTTASSGWGIHGKLVVQAKEDYVLMQVCEILYLHQSLPRFNTRSLSYRELLTYLSLIDVNQGNDHS